MPTSSCCVPVPTRCFFQCLNLLTLRYRYATTSSARLRTPPSIFAYGKGKTRTSLSGFILRASAIRRFRSIGLRSSSAKSTATSGETRPETYLAATPCVQSQADEITKLAADLWPDSGKVRDYAVNIQRFVREMKQVERPRSLDALTILESGANGICTGNTNLATALLRSRSIPSRSVAAIPPISSRLEMHRIVEYYDDGQWLLFDPSSVQTEIPLEPWHSIIMARTTISDENIAMQPRMGTTVGCPYGQELELVSNRITLRGQEFFWTIAKPIAEFEPSQEALVLATDAWTRYLELGTLSPGQVKAASAKDAAGFVKLLGTK